MPEISIRTGDTAQKERARFRRHPGDILITTPESLYLCSPRTQREALRAVETVIIDEIHALVPTKRGAHLALSLERLEALVRASGGRRCSGSACRPRSGRSRKWRGSSAARTGARAAASEAAGAASRHMRKRSAARQTLEVADERTQTAADESPPACATARSPSSTPARARLLELQRRSPGRRHGAARRDRGAAQRPGVARPEAHLDLAVASIRGCWRSSASAPRR